MNTFKYENVYIENTYSLLGRNEHKPDILSKVDKVINSYYNNEKTVELAEISFQQETIEGLLKKVKISSDKVDLAIGGDLQNQLLGSNMGIKKFAIPFLGIYSACSTFTEGLIIASTLIDKSFINNAIVTTSAHNLVCEKQFRFPIEYGAIRKKVNTFTATGSVSVLVSNKKSEYKINNSTIGKVMDLNYKDVNNMGACMAPGAAEVIYDHLKNLNINANYYDLILTGDLGKYGVKILKEYLLKKYNIMLENVKDAGSLLYDAENNNNIAGGSGPICLPLVLFNQISKTKYRKILIVGTGSLHSATSSNLKLSVPCISHAVELEVIKWFI